jgi:hypothetical protein
VVFEDETVGWGGFCGGVDGDSGGEGGGYVWEGQQDRIVGWKRTVWLNRM